ncbi:MAG: flagellar protein FlaG [Leptospirales bacterium]|nr:flagellar protein FlaG [Leptospirales bacterium]
MDVGRITTGRDILRLNNNATDGVSVLKKTNQEPAHNALSRLTGSVLGYNERIRFSYNEETNSIIMRVVDSSTDEVIREIPSKQAIKILKYLQEYTGLLVDESR